MLKSKRTKNCRKWVVTIALESCKLICDHWFSLRKEKWENLFLPFARVCCETTTKCILGGSALGSRKETSYETGRRAVNDLVQTIEAGSCVDRYVQDQVIIFMALAKGISRIRTDFPLTMHTQTAIYIAELLTNVSLFNSISIRLSSFCWFPSFFFQAKFTVTEEGSTCIVQCMGIGLENEFIWFFSNCYSITNINDQYIPIKTTK